MEMNWFMVYTKPDAEKKVLNLLAQKNIEHYWPQYKDAYDGHNKNFHYHPLLKGYVFVRAKENTLQDLKKIPGIVNTVYWQNKPVVIADAEIKYLKDFLESYADISVEKINVNIQWSTTAGNQTLIQTENIYKDNVEQKSLVLFSLGYKITARLKKGQVQIISSWHSQKHTVPNKFSLTHWILGNQS